MKFLWRKAALFPLVLYPEQPDPDGEEEECDNTAVDDDAAEESRSRQTTQYYRLVGESYIPRHHVW